MAQEYIVERISQSQPREWKSDYGTIFYIKTMLKGHDKPVEIGKKSPDALKTGDTVYGTIKATDFEVDRFKSEKDPNASGTRQPKDEAAIKAMWAIGQSIELATARGKLDMQKIESDAKELYSMVDRVKNPKADGGIGQSGYEQAKSVAASLKGDEEPPLSEEDYQKVLGSSFDDEGEPINLDDIPF